MCERASAAEFAVPLTCWMSVVGEVCKESPSLNELTAEKVKVYGQLASIIVYPLRRGGSA